MRLVSLFLMLLIPLSGVLGRSVPGEGTDRVDRKKGAPIVGVEIVSEDYKAVVVKSKAGTKSIPASEVLGIQREDEPQSYRDGRNYLLTGDLNNAINALRLAGTKADGKPWLKEYASFYLGEAYRLAGKATEAVAAYEDALKVKPDSRFLPRARLGIARAYTAAKRYEQAETVLKAFADEVNSKRLDVAYRIEASRMRGRNQEAQGRFGEAASHYNTVATEARGEARKVQGEQQEELMALALRAEADKGMAQVDAKNYSGARQLFDGMARNNRTNAIAQALAAIGLGATALGEGDADQARVLLTEAAMLHFKAESERPRALLLLGKAYFALDEKGEKGARKMARLYLDDLKRLYPTSEFAAEAMALLAGSQ